MATFACSFGLRKYLPSFFRGIERNDGDAGEPQHCKSARYDLLQIVEMVRIFARVAIHQSLDHGEVAHQHEAQSHAACNQVKVDDSESEQIQYVLLYCAK